MYLSPLEHKPISCTKQDPRRQMDKLSARRLTIVQNVLEFSLWRAILVWAGDLIMWEAWGSGYDVNTEDSICSGKVRFRNEWRWWKLDAKDLRGRAILRWEKSEDFNAKNPWESDNKMERSKRWLVLERICFKLVRAGGAWTGACIHWTAEPAPGGNNVWRKHQADVPAMYRIL